jgi:hypothetical protein
MVEMEKAGLLLFDVCMENFETMLYKICEK